MKVAVVYNRDKKGIINVFGIQNREWYPEETIQKVASALEKGGHTVELIVADRFLLSRLNKFLPKLSKRRANGIVFNLALGIQGAGRGDKHRRPPLGWCPTVCHLVGILRSRAYL